MTTRSGGGTARTTRCWSSPNGTRNRRERSWKRVSSLRQLARLVLRRARQDRIAVKVDEHDPAAAPHHPPGGDRRVDAARQQAHDLAAGADGQPAGARLLAEEVERVVGQHLDVDGQLRIAADRRASPRAILIRPPTSRSISGDGIGNRLSARRAETRNDRRILRHRDPRGSPAAIASMSSARPAGPGKIADAEARRDTRSRTRVPVRARLQDDLDAAHQRAARRARRRRASPPADCRTSRVMNHGRFFPLSAISW